MPASASVKASSMPKRSWCSGETVQRMAEKSGRSASSLLPPASASAMRMRLRASRSSLMLTTMLCLPDARTQASNSCSTRVSSGVSWADDEGRGGREAVEALHDAGGVRDVTLDRRRGSSRRLRVRASRSRRRRGRRARRRRGRSKAGSRAPRVKRRGTVARARPTRSGGSLATVVSRSTGGAVLLEHVERLLRVEHARRCGEHVQCRLVDALDLGRRQNVDQRSPADVMQVGVSLPAGHRSITSCCRRGAGDVRQSRVGRAHVGHRPPRHGTGRAEAKGIRSRAPCRPRRRSHGGRR